MLNEQQTLITEAARRFVRERIIDTKLDQTLDQSGAFPHDILRELWTQGLVNLEFPEAVGGPALSCHDHVLVLEELNYGCLGIGTSAVANSLAGLPLQMCSNEAVRKKYLGRLMAEPAYAAFACSEPDAGSDVANMSTRYERRGDTLILNGRKRWITNADVADFYVVFAREQGSKGHQGISALVIDAGVIRRARDEAVAYAMQRKAFGEPIINHQMVAAMLADMEIAYQATRLLTLNAALEVDAGNLRGSHSACAKAFGGDSAMKVTTDAVQVFGGYGYTQDFIVEKLMRDAKLLQIYEGTSQIQRLVIARDLMRAHG